MSVTVARQDSETSPLSRLDWLVWLIVACIAAIDLAAPLVSDFRIDWRAFAVPLATGTALLAAANFYRLRRPDPKLACALGSTAQVVLIAAVGAPLSYLAAAANLPLRDGLFAAADRALGFDWMALLALLNANPAAYKSLGLVYGSLTVQMTTAVLCLAFMGRLLWVRVYTLSFVLAVLATIAVSVVLPAAGAWPHYGLTAADSPHLMPVVADSWPVFYGLRDGSYRDLVALGAKGIITFPSLHAALAVILILAMWPLRLLRWPILILNAAMLAATPIDGSHYLTDIIAGVGVALGSFAGAYYLARRLMQAQSRGEAVSRAQAALPAGH